LISFLFPEDSLSINNDKFSYLKSIYSDSWAIIIGINDYEHVEPLSYAVDDAVSVKELLVEDYGFPEQNVRLITDKHATKDNILQGFNDILLQAKEKDRVVVFFAGHGETYSMPSGGDMGYLVPVDGEADNLFLTGIPMSMIYQIAGMSAAKHILYLVDACYGGLTLVTRGLGKPQTPEYLRKMTKEKGRQVITAGGKDEKVTERPEWGHSAFTRNLLAGLKDGLADENMDDIITAEELGLFIKNRVVVDSDGAHTPQIGRIGSEEGEFVLINKMVYDQIPDPSRQEPTNVEVGKMQSEIAEIKKLLLEQSKSELSNQVKEPAKKSHFIRNTIIGGLLVGAGYAAYIYFGQKDLENQPGIASPPGFPVNP